MSDERLLSWQVGDARITRVVELTTATIGAHILPQATPDALAGMPWLAPFLDEAGRPLLSMHALVVETPERTLMVDTCIGNDKSRTYPRWNHMQSDFLERLANAGWPTDAIDTVLCTHMHVDHVGWNTRLVDERWVPTFANARYLFAESEYEHWRSEPQEFGPVFEDSVAPVFDAGLAELVTSDFEVCDGVRLVPTPGHTPGHVSVSIRSRGEAAIITGDMVHHPCQLARHEWSSTADVDPAQAAVTRQAFVEQFADSPVLVVGTHFAGPTAGRIVRDGASFRLDY